MRRPAAVGMIASERLKVMAAIAADFSPLTAPKEVRIPTNVPNAPTNAALDAIAARLA
jgi:hypothetical protein